MKTRTRSTPVVTPSSTLLNYYDDPADTTHYGTIKSGTTAAAQIFNGILDNKETIVDEEPGFMTFGNCEHTRASLVCYESAKTERITRLDGSHEKLVRQPWFLVNQYHAAIRNTPSPLFQQEQWSGWSAEALESLMPTFSQGGESLVNFVLELKQTKSLFDVWKRKYSLLKNIANGHLNLSFGWRPFLSDVQRIFNSLKDFRKKVRELQKNSKIPQRRHYRRYVDIATLPLDLIVASDGPNAVVREVDWIQKPIYVATVNYIYVLPDMSDPLNQVAAFLDSVGVQLDASIVWNAIPYSFVVDWFFNVGEWIGKLRADNLKIPATVTGFCHSLKWEYRSRYIYSSSPTATNLGDKMVLLADREVLRYIRRRDIPSWGLDLTVRTPNWGQLALGASLLRQRFGNVTLVLGKGGRGSWTRVRKIF